MGVASVNCVTKSLLAEVMSNRVTGKSERKASLCGDHCIGTFALFTGLALQSLDAAKVSSGAEDSSCSVHLKVLRIKEAEVAYSEALDVCRQLAKVSIVVYQPYVLGTLVGHVHIIEALR